MPHLLSAMSEGLQEKVLRHRIHHRPEATSRILSSRLLGGVGRGLEMEESINYVAIFITWDSCEQCIYLLSKCTMRLFIFIMPNDRMWGRDRNGREPGHNSSGLVGL